MTSGACWPYAQRAEVLCGPGSTRTAPQDLEAGKITVSTFLWFPFGLWSGYSVSRGCFSHHSGGQFNVCYEFQKPSVKQIVELRTPEAGSKGSQGLCEALEGARL